MSRMSGPVVIAAVATAFVASVFAMPPRDTERLRNRNESVQEGRAAVLGAENLLALHKPDSGSYNGNCLSCHKSVMSEESLDPRVPSFHVAMVPYTPGYNPAKGVTNGVCVQCHKYVDLEVDSSGALRKRVDPALCALCHGPSGPGPVFYMR